MIRLPSCLGNHSRSDPFTHAIRRNRQILSGRPISFIMFSHLRLDFLWFVEPPSRGRKILQGDWLKSMHSIPTIRSFCHMKQVENTNSRSLLSECTACPAV